MIAIMFEEMFSGLIGARTLAFTAGDTIFRQGAPSHAIFHVRVGKVAVVRQLADGGFVTVATAGPGETFAEAALFADRYHCDAVARSDCEVMSVPTKAVLELLQREPERAQALASLFARQVRDLRMRLELLRIKRAPDRVLAWLRWRAGGDPPTVTAPDVWANVASEIGLSPEALYRALRTLVRSGAIERRAGAVMLRAREPVGTFHLEGRARRDS